MSPTQKQQLLINRFLPIDDLHERLAIVVDRARHLLALPESERSETNRVQGCASRVWLTATLEEGRCRFQVDADSALVKGLAALLCEVVDGATPGEVAAFRSTLLESLHLIEHLSPTRQHGLAQVQRALRDFAERMLAAEAAP